MSNINIEKLNKLLELLQADTITTTQIGQFLNLVLGVIKQSKESFDSISQKNLGKIDEALSYMEGEHSSLLKDFQNELKAVRALRAIPGPTGKDGKTPIAGIDYQVPDEARIIEAVLSFVPKVKDGSPDTPEEVRDKLETLEGKQRLDASAIKNLPEATKKIVTEVGGIRYLENLADVSIDITKKRADLITQYNTTNNRWQDGIAITVSATQPTAPQINDLWIQL